MHQVDLDSGLFSCPLFELPEERQSAGKQKKRRNSRWEKTPVLSLGAVSLACPAACREVHLPILDPVVFKPGVIASPKQKTKALLPATFLPTLAALRLFGTHQAIKGAGSICNGMTLPRRKPQPHLPWYLCWQCLQCSPKFLC